MAIAGTAWGGGGGGGLLLSSLLFLLSFMFLDLDLDPDLESLTLILFIPVRIALFVAKRCDAQVWAAPLQIRNHPRCLPLPVALSLSVDFFTYRPTD